jgi:hypothetical protein
MTKKKKKFASGNFFFQKLPFTCPQAFIKKIQKKPSDLKREHPALQNMKFLFYVCGSFLPSWIRIRIQSQSKEVTRGPPELVQLFRL